MHCSPLPLPAPPCEQTTWFVAGLMGWNVTGYVFICLIWSPAWEGGQEREKERKGEKGSQREKDREGEKRGK